MARAGHPLGPPPAPLARVFFGRLLRPPARLLTCPALRDSTTRERARDAFLTRASAAAACVSFPLFTSAAGSPSRAAFRRLRR